MATFYAQSGVAPGGNGSLAAPFNNLGTSWPGVTAGDTVRLVAGSYFRESFTALNFAGLTIEGWGAGPLPVVSGANIVTSWTPQGGGIFSWSAGSNLCGNVAMNGQPMLWKAWAGSLGATALEPGAFSFDFTGFVLYVRPPDGIVTGKTFSVSVRPVLLDEDTTRDGFVLRNVRFEQASRHAVAILNCTNWLVEDCEFQLVGGFRDPGTYVGNAVEVAAASSDGIGRRLRMKDIFDAAVTSQLYEVAPTVLRRNHWSDITVDGAGLAGCEFNTLTANQTLSDMRATRIHARNIGITGWLSLRTGVDGYGVGVINIGGASSSIDRVVIEGCDIETTRYGVISSSSTNGPTNVLVRGNRIKGLGSLADDQHQGVRLVNSGPTLESNLISGFWAGVNTAGGTSYTVNVRNNEMDGNLRHFFRNAEFANYVATNNVLQGSTQIYGSNFVGGFSGSKNALFGNAATGSEYSSTADITLPSAVTIGAGLRLGSALIRAGAAVARGRDIRGVLRHPTTPTIGAFEAARLWRA